MTPRERMERLFSSKDSGEPVVCLHTWGRYPFDLLGRSDVWDRGNACAMADVYLEFQERFPTDWFHVCEGWGEPVTIPPLPPPATRADIDGWIARNGDGQMLSYDSMMRSGMYAHVAELVRRAGREMMIAPNQGAPGSGFPGRSWEDQLMLIQQDPGLVRHFVRADDRRFLERVHVACDLGADAYIFSEGYCGACDLISPRLFEEVFLEPKREFYEEVRQLGLKGVGYFLGGIAPYLDVINRIRPDGVLIEESKKTFVLDPVEIRRRLDPRIVLFGNVDSYLLLAGTPGEIRESVRRQSEARAHGPFVLANGSPICPETPPRNLEAFLEAAREV